MFVIYINGISSDVTYNLRLFAYDALFFVIVESDIANIFHIEDIKNGLRYGQLTCSKTINLAGGISIFILLNLGVNRSCIDNKLIVKQFLVYKCTDLHGFTRISVMLKQRGLFILCSY